MFSEGMVDQGSCVATPFEGYDSYADLDASAATTYIGKAGEVRTRWNGKAAGPAISSRLGMELFSMLSRWSLKRFPCRLVGPISKKDRKARCVRLSLSDRLCAYGEKRGGYLATQASSRGPRYELARSPGRVTRRRWNACRLSADLKWTHLGASN